MQTREWMCGRYLLFAVIVHCSAQIPDAPTANSILGAWFKKLEAVDETCAEMDTWQLVVTAFLKYSTSSLMCPHLRYASPSQLLIVPLASTFGWLSFPYDPDGNNCAPPEGDVLCMWLRMYLVLLDLLRPMLIIKAFIIGYWDLIMYVLRGLHHLLKALMAEMHDLHKRYLIAFKSTRHS